MGPSTTCNFARRKLDSGDFVRAKELVEKNLQDDGSTEAPKIFDDQRALAFVYASFQGSADPSRAINLFEDC